MHARKRGSGNGLATGGLVDHLSCRARAPAAAGGDPQRALDLAKAKPGLDLAGDLTVGDAVADTDDHEEFARLAGTGLSANCP